MSLVGGSIFPSAMPKMATQTDINVRDARNIMPLPISYINYCMDYRDCTQNPISPRLSSEALLNAPYTAFGNCICIDIDNCMHIINKETSTLALNPDAATFYPQCSFSSVTSCFNEIGTDLNLYAREFIPRSIINRSNWVIASMFCLFTIILLFLLTALNIICISDIDELSPKELVQKMKCKNPNNIIIGHLNINFIRQKLEFLMEIIGTNIDLLLISETKLNATFPLASSSLMDSMFLLEKIGMIKGVVFFFRKSKWILIGSYNPHKDLIRNHLSSIGGKLNELCLKYEHFILIGDFNSEMRKEPMQVFCDTYNFKCLVKEPTCYKNMDNPSCIDLILTNKSLSFQHTSTIETGLSDFHKLTITTMKSTFYKQAPKIIQYRNYKHFNNDIF